METIAIKLENFKTRSWLHFSYFKVKG